MPYKKSRKGAGVSLEMVGPGVYLFRPKNPERPERVEKVVGVGEAARRRAALGEPGRGDGEGARASC
jgi:hypothetical protein